MAPTGRTQALPHPPPAVLHPPGRPPPPPSTSNPILLIWMSSFFYKYRMMMRGVVKSWINRSDFDFIWFAVVCPQSKGIISFDSTVGGRVTCRIENKVAVDYHAIDLFLIGNVAVSSITHTSMAVGHRRKINWHTSSHRIRYRVFDLAIRWWRFS